MATPHPETVIAMLSSILRNMENAVNGSIVATGAPPSTEEEAFRYNQARDRGVAGAFDAVSTFGPGAPQFAGASRYLASRPVPQALEVGVPRYLSGSGNMSGSAALPPPDRFRANSSGWSSSGGSVPIVPSPAAGSAPSGGVLARLRELDAVERQATGAGLPPPVKDPNFRQISRIVVRPLEVASPIFGRSSSVESLNPEIEGPEGLYARPQQDFEQDAEYEQRVDGTNFPGFGGKGGGPGKGGGEGKGGGNGDNGDNVHPCTERWMDEKDNWCPQFWKAGERWVSACESRAADRLRLCHRNKGPAPDEPDRYDWKDIMPKPLKRYSLRPKR